MSDKMSETLRIVAEGLRTPVIIVLLLLIALTVALFGTLIAELFTERLRMTAKLPRLIEALRDKNRLREEAITSSGLLKRQKTALLQLIKYEGISSVKHEALARRLLFEEQNRYDRIVQISDIIARIGPMAGLMGTLIPLGPGLIALGQGDTYTLAQSLLVAFDTTIAGLCVAAVAFIISAVRKNWYENYMVMLEAVMECIVDREYEADRDPLNIKSEQRIESE